MTVNENCSPQWLPLIVYTCLFHMLHTVRKGGWGLLELRWWLVHAGLPFSLGSAFYYEVQFAARFNNTLSRTPIIVMKPEIFTCKN